MPEETGAVLPASVGTAITPTKQHAPHTTWCWTLAGEPQMRVGTWLLCETFLCLSPQASFSAASPAYLFPSLTQEGQQCFAERHSEDNPAYHHGRLQRASVTTSCELKQRWGSQVPVAVTLMCPKQHTSDCCHRSCWVGTRLQWSQSVSHPNGVTSLMHK